ncbi:hypothetical protein [Cyanobium sp. ATX-6F1]|uniref:hypothetical protein n=1 Tax=Cyanobium sp. ATX-6F1 TaxID=3137388 RepID=UPI0039BE6FAA
MAEQINSAQPQDQDRPEGEPQPSGENPAGEGSSVEPSAGTRRGAARIVGRGSGDRGGGERGGASREAGGFRIRLSDNELRAAQAVQEAFQLRSTVAALGLSIRTVAQLLEQGQLDALVAQHHAGGGGAGGGGGVRAEGGPSERRGPRPERSGEGRGERPSSRPNPFARPSRPAPRADPERTGAP